MRSRLILLPMGLMLTVASLSGILSFGPSLLGHRRFTCERTLPTIVNCTSVFRPLLPFLPTQTKVYPAVQGANTKTETHTDSDGDTTARYFMTLKTSGGEVEALSLGSEAEAQQAAQQVAAFLRSTEVTLSLQDHHSTIGWMYLWGLGYTLFLGLFLLVGVGLLGGVFPRSGVILDKANRQIRQIGGFPFAPTTNQPWSALQAVVLQPYGDADEHTVTIVGRSPQPFLQLFFGERASAQTEAQELSAFLEVPLQEKAAEAAPAAVQRAAQEIREVLATAYAPEHEWVRVNPADFPQVNRKFYDRAQAELEKLGFQLLGDAENLTLSRMDPAARTFVRMLVSRDGRILAGVFAIGTSGLAKWLQAVGLVPKLEVVELESELTDGSFVVTSGTQGLQPLEEIPGIQMSLYPPATPIGDLVKAHQQALRPAAPANPVVSYEAAILFQNRLQALTSRHKQATGFGAEDVQRYAQPHQQELAREVGKAIESMKSEEKSAD